MSEEQVLQIVVPAISPEEVKLAMKRFSDIEKAMLDEGDYQEFLRAGKTHRFPKKSAFRKIALAFNLSDEILNERFETKGENGQIRIWHFTVKAIAPNGRYSVGVGSFSTDEREVSHLEHDGRAMAHTRAKNRAISDLVAGGILSAEEVLGIIDYKASYGKPVPPMVSKEDTLKKLYQQIGIESRKVFASDEERKAWQKEQYGADSMTQMGREQLEDMLSKIREMQQPKIGVTQQPEQQLDITRLGFSSEAEQKQARKELFALMHEAGYQTDEQKREWIQGNKPRTEITKTTELTKEEVSKLKELLTTKLQDLS